MKRLFILLGFLYILLGIISVAYSIYINNPSQVYWICYASMILIGIGFIKKSSILLTSQLNILLIPYTIWNIDFFYQLISQKELWGITNYFFNGYTTLGMIISTQHIFTIPLILFGLYSLKIKDSSAWKISFIQIVLIFLMTKTFTDEIYNINCVFKSCIPINPYPYELFWILAYFIMIYLTNFLFCKIPIFKNKSKKIIS